MCIAHTAGPLDGFEPDKVDGLCDKLVATRSTPYQDRYVPGLTEEEIDASIDEQNRRAYIAQGRALRRCLERPE
jgi:hypothetical protein